MEQSSKHNKNRILHDIILIAALLAIALITLLITRTDKKSAKEVCVEVNGAETARYSLSSDGTYPLNGGTNILRIENNTAYLEEANCPDKLCVKQGKISSPGQSIICLPNKLIITATGGKAKDNIDITQ